MKIVTFNLRCCWDDVDGGNTFVSRAGAILIKIDLEKPDLICFQEATEDNIPFLRKHLNDYYIIFNSRLTDLRGEGLAIAYRKNILELFGLDVFWLSPTPNIPGSRYEIQSPYPRVCQVAMFRTESNKLFRVCNVHLDHESDEARILGIQQILCYFNNLAGRNETPFFVLGDFNAEPGSRTINYCDSYKELPIIDLTKGISGTYHDFGKTYEKIDYIYTDVETAKIDHVITVWDDENKTNGRFLSDHYPILLELEL